MILDIPTSIMLAANHRTGGLRMLPEYIPTYRKRSGLRFICSEEKAIEGLARLLVPHALEIYYANQREKRRIKRRAAGLKGAELSRKRRLSRLLAASQLSIGATK